MPFFLFLSVTEGLKNYYMLGKMQLMTVFFFLPFLSFFFVPLLLDEDFRKHLVPDTSFIIKQERNVK